MNSRRNFFKKTALLAGATALPLTKALAQDDVVQTTATTTGKLPYKNTYVKNVFVAENEFRNATLNIIESPGFEKARAILPDPFWKGNDNAINMYWKTWEIAFRNIKNPTKESGFISSYIDTAYNGNIFMWDSNFITLFARYGSRAYPSRKRWIIFMPNNTPMVLSAGRFGEIPARIVSIGTTPPALGPT
jgi:hypothetical protein